MKPLILASGSPRRAKILRDLGVEFEIVKTEAPEVSIPHDPVRTVTDNALAKLRAAVAQERDSTGAAPAGRHILAADTIVWFNGKIYGKPRDLAEAKVFLRELSGQTHTVFTGVAYVGPDGAAAIPANVLPRQAASVPANVLPQQAASVPANVLPQQAASVLKSLAPSTACARSHVTFRQLSDAAIEEYVARVRPIDRAGAYDIDESGDLIVASYDGEYENIMGLPVEPLRRFGII